MSVGRAIHNGAARRSSSEWQRILTDRDLWRAEAARARAASARHRSYRSGSAATRYSSAAPRRCGWPGDAHSALGESVSPATQADGWRRDRAPPSAQTTALGGRADRHESRRSAHEAGVIRRLHSWCLLVLSGGAGTGRLQPLGPTSYCRSSPTTPMTRVKSKIARWTSR